MFPLRDAFNQAVFMGLLFVAICIATFTGCRENPPSLSQLRDASNNDASLPDAALDTEDSTPDDVDEDFSAAVDVGTYPSCFEGVPANRIGNTGAGPWLPPFPSHRFEIVESLPDQNVNFGTRENPIRVNHRLFTLSGDNGDVEKVVFSFPDAFGPNEVELPAPGQEVYATGINCDNGSYTVLETAEGEILWEGGDDTCQCQGDVTGFEASCQPTRRFALERHLPMETLPICTSYEHISPECSHTLTFYPATLQTDEGRVALPPQTVVDVTINQRPYKAIYFYGGFFHCPCADDCDGIRSSFVMLPAAP